MPTLATNPTPELLPLRSGTSVEAVRKTHTDELVIALCGPMGSPVHVIADKLQQVLINQFHYDCKIIKLSKFIEDKEGAVPDEVSRFDRKKQLIEKGNQLRYRHGPGVLAELAIGEISLAR